MQHEGTIIFDAPRQDLFDLLVDGETLSQCVPGVKAAEVVEPGVSFRVVAQAKFGMLQPEMDLQVRFTVLEPPERARLRIRGKGASSHIGASSYIYLEELPAGGTEMHWSFTYSVYGQLATIGQRLQQQAFERLHEQFIAAVRELVARRLPRSV